MCMQLFRRLGFLVVISVLLLVFFSCNKNCTWDLNSSGEVLGYDIDLMSSGCFDTSGTIDEQSSVSVLGVSEDFDFLVFSSNLGETVTMENIEELCEEGRMRFMEFTGELSLSSGAIYMTTGDAQVGFGGCE